MQNIIFPMKTTLLSALILFTSFNLLAQQEVPYIPLNSNHVKYYDSIEALISNELPNDFSAYNPEFAQRANNNGCPTGDVIITSQAEINALLGCTEIPGDLVIIGTNIIDGDTTITDLSPLNDLINITGDIIIGGLPEVITLPTFESLININGDYRIFSMPLLTSLPNVPNQATLSGEIQFSLLPQVTTLPPGLSNLVSTTGSITFSNLSGITAIPTLTNLQTVGDFLSFTTLPISNLPNLENLNSVGGFLNVIGLSQITQVNLPSLVTIGDALNTQNNAALTQINVPLLQTVGQVLIASNPSMTQIDGFPSLTEISSRLGIAAQNNITNVSAFSNLQTIGFFLLHSTNFTNVDFLSNVTAMTTGFQIVLNPDLTNLNGLNNATIVQGIANDFPNVIVVNDCPNLTTLGTVNLTTNGHFENVSIFADPIDNAGNLTNLAALSGISGDLNLLSIRLTGIGNVDFLSNINKVNILSLSNNNNLTDINGIAGIDVSDMTNLTIANNPLLDNCAVAAVCDALNLSNLNNGEPTVSIRGNNTNCDSIVTVDTACQSLSVSDFIGIDIKASPNPFTNIINIQLPLGVDNATVRILNIAGKAILTKEVNQNQASIDQLQSLTSGFYLVQVTLPSGAQVTYKMVK